MTVEKTSGYQQIGTLVAASLRYKVGKPTSDTINVFIHSCKCHQRIVILASGLQVTLKVYVVF